MRFHTVPLLAKYILILFKVFFIRFMATSLIITDFSILLLRLMIIIDLLKHLLQHIDLLPQLTILNVNACPMPRSSLITTDTRAVEI